MKILAIFLLLCSTCIAQTVEVKDILNGVDGYKIIAGKLFVPPDSKPTVDQVALITVPPEWMADPTKCAQIVVEDGNDDKIPYETLDVGIFQVNGTGIVKVQIVNPAPFYFNRWKIKLAPPIPDPGPGPVIPDPPGPSPVPNAYNIGLIAYQNAPKNPETLAKYASVYEQAGNFLFGTPTLKAISFPNEADNKNPDKSVLAWMAKEITAIQCPDITTCQQWNTWKAAVYKAFADAQTARTFTKQDWYMAFNEVAFALRMVK